jgi:hypothetical protein
MGHPELYKWVKGQELKHSSSICSAVVYHTILMVFFTTFMGLSMALGVLWAKMTLIAILFALTGRRIAGLIWMAKLTRAGPAILKYLGTISSSEFRQGGNHGERMMRLKWLEKWRKTHRMTNQERDIYKQCVVMGILNDGVESLR